MSISAVLDLIQSQSTEAKFMSGYYQAQVTAVDSSTGQVYLQQIDDENDAPDEAPYTALRGFLPQVGDWVWVVRWGRTSVVVGALNREDTTLPSFFILPSGQVIAWGIDDPNGDADYALPMGSIYLRSAGGITRENASFYIKTTDAPNAYGWSAPHDAPRTRSRRQLIAYAGASTTSSFARSGFPDDPTITAASAANADASTGAFLSLNTSTVANNVAKIVGGANSPTQTQWTPNTVIVTRAGGVVTSVRYWFGVFSGDPSASDDPAVSAVGFRFSTNASDVNLMAYTNDGSGGGTVTDTGLAFVAGTAYEFRMAISDSVVDFYISGNWVARHTTNLPAVSTALTYGLYCTTLNTTQKNLRLGRVSIDSEP